MEMQITACRRIHLQGFVTSAGPTICSVKKGESACEALCRLGDSCRHREDEPIADSRSSSMKQAEPRSACGSKSFEVLARRCDISDADVMRRHISTDAHLKTWPRPRNEAHVCILHEEA